MFSSILTGSGQNAAKKQNKQNSKVAGTYAGLFNDAAGQYGDWQSALGAMHLDGSLGTILNQINQDPSHLVSQYGAGAQEHAANAASQYANFLKSQGYGDGAVQGAGQGFYQDAARQTNAYAAQQYSPQARAQALQALFQSIAQGNDVFGGALNSLGSGVYGQPTVQAQSSPLAGLLGSLAGGAISSLAAPVAGANSFLSSLPNGGAGISAPTSSNPFYR